jgi:hypothetical protein
MTRSNSNALSRTLAVISVGTRSTWDMPKEELADALLGMAGASHKYLPPGGVDPLAAMNDSWGKRFEPGETVADLLRELRDKNQISEVLCLQAAEVIEQLLEGRPADSVALMVEDR